MLDEVAGFVHPDAYDHDYDYFDDFSDDDCLGEQLDCVEELRWADEN